MAELGRGGGITRRGVLSVAGAGLSALALPAQARCAPAGRIIEIGAPSGLLVGLKSYPQTLALEDGEIALTLDDGPLPGPTDRVLDALRAYDVKATFFLIGRNAQANPNLVRRMAAEGHTVAHHTQNHFWTLRRRSFEVGAADIEAGFRAVQAAQGIGGDEIVTPFFRYPGFADTPPLNAWLASKRISVFGADLWASDWRQMSAEAQLTLLMGRLRRQRKGIVLLHDVVGQTAEMFPNFLRALCEGGYRVVSLTPGRESPALASAPRGWRSFTDRLAGPA